MLKTGQLPEKISETIKALYFSIKNLEKYSVSDFDIYLGATSTFDAKIDSFLSVSSRKEVTEEINTVEYTQYSLKELTNCNIFLSKDLDLISSEKELFFPDSVKKVKTLVRFNPEKGGILSLFPIFYTLGNIEKPEDILVESRVFRDKFFEYKAKISTALKHGTKESELINCLSEIKFDSGNFVGEDFIIVVKSDNEDFTKIKMLVKIDSENYFAITNISYADITKEKTDLQPILLSNILLFEKLRKSVDCFIETFNKDFLVESL